MIKTSAWSGASLVLGRYVVVARRGIAEWGRRRPRRLRRYKGVGKRVHTASAARTHTRVSSHVSVAEKRWRRHPQMPGIIGLTYTHTPHTHTQTHTFVAKPFDRRLSRVLG